MSKFDRAYLTVRLIEAKHLSRVFSEYCDGMEYSKNNFYSLAYEKREVISKIARKALMDEITEITKEKCESKAEVRSIEELTYRKAFELTKKNQRTLMNREYPDKYFYEMSSCGDLKTRALVAASRCIDLEIIGPEISSNLKKILQIPF